MIDYWGVKGAEPSNKKTLNHLLNKKKNVVAAALEGLKRGSVTNLLHSPVIRSWKSDYHKCSSQFLYKIIL